jgi:hypothetical protein
MGSHHIEEMSMSKYLLLKHYRRSSGPEHLAVPGADWSHSGIPMDQWTPEEIDDHVKYMNDFAALHVDARSVEETDWVQIVEWYDELLEMTHSPVVRLNRAVAIGQADGARAGSPPLPRWTLRFPVTARRPPSFTSRTVTSLWR